MSPHIDMLRQAAKKTKGNLSKIWQDLDLQKNIYRILLQSTFGCWMLGEVQLPHWPLSLSMIL